MIKSGIYKILNIKNNKVYIGSTTNFNKRKNEHLKRLRKNKHENKYLQRAFNKYKEDNIKFELIEEINDIGLLIERELY